MRTADGKTSAETPFGITSLTRGEADAGRLPGLVRSHWSVEALFEALFHVRDVTFGEDTCRESTGAAPAVLSGFRNAAVTLLGQAGCGNVAAALRRHAARPGEAIALMKSRPG